MPKPLVALIAASVIVLIAAVWVLVTEFPNERRQRETCEALMTTLLKSKDAVEVNRAGWLLYELDCNARRNRATMQAAILTGAIVGATSGQ